MYINYLLYLCKEEDKIPRPADLMQDTLQAVGFDGKQRSERVCIQGNALDVFGAEGPLGDHRLGLAFQPDHRLVYRVDSRTAGGVYDSQALLCRNAKCSRNYLFLRHVAVYDI